MIIPIKELNTIIPKWINNTATQDEIERLYIFLHNYIHAVIKKKSAYIRYLCIDGEISDGDWFLYLDKRKHKYNKDIAEFRVWLWWQIQGYCKSKTDKKRRDINHQVIIDKAEELIMDRYTVFDYALLDDVEKDIDDKEL